MRRAFGSWLLAGVCSLGCSAEVEPRAEWLVSLSTDAPVPQLGDRLLVETLDENGELACEGCRRVLAAASAEALPVSFSVVPNGRRLLLRTRLYRARISGRDGLPGTDRLVDDIAILPDTTTRTALTVQLSLACFGVPSDWDGQRSCSPETGELAPLRTLGKGSALVPGSSPLAVSRDCSGEPPPGMRCIPGGLFVRGDQAALSVRIESNARPETLVKLSPFFLDEDEVTVGQVRELVRSTRIKRAPAARGPATDITSGCTYVGETDRSNDAYPVNCVQLTQARQVCAALGKRLPTEAEWEYAAGNRNDETTYPWGSDASICEHAVVARANLNLGALFGGDVSCLGLGDYEPLASPAPGGEPLDLTRQGVRNLGGNVSELVDDAFASYTAACWGSAEVLQNPHCDMGDVPRFPVSLRGGSWVSNLVAAPAVARNGIHEGAQGDPGTGFRCAQGAE